MRYAQPVLVGRNYERLWLQREIIPSGLSYYLTEDKGAKRRCSVRVRVSRLDPFLEYKALLRLQKKYGKEIRPVACYLLKNDVEDWRLDLAE